MSLYSLKRRRKSVQTFFPASFQRQNAAGTKQVTYVTLIILTALTKDKKHTPSLICCPILDFWIDLKLRQSDSVTTRSGPDLLGHSVHQKSSASHRHLVILLQKRRSSRVRLTRPSNRDREQESCVQNEQPKTCATMGRRL